MWQCMSSMSFISGSWYGWMMESVWKFLLMAASVWFVWWLCRKWWFAVWLLYSFCWKVLYWCTWFCWLWMLLFAFVSCMCMFWVMKPSDPDVWAWLTLFAREFGFDSWLALKWLTSFVSLVYETGYWAPELWKVFWFLVKLLFDPPDAFWTLCLLPSLSFLAYIWDLMVSIFLLVVEDIIDCLNCPCSMELLAKASCLADFGFETIEDWLPFELLLLPAWPI